MSAGETINFLLGCQPDIAALPATVLTAGGEATNRLVSALKTRSPSDFWRTPTLKPFHTQFTADFGSALLSRCLFLGGVVLPEKTALCRVRKGTSVADEWIRPNSRTNGSGDALTAGSNVTGSLSDLDDNPLAPNADAVTPSNPALAMSFRAAMRKPVNPPKTGAYLQGLQVAYKAVAAAVPGSCAITVELWQSGALIAGVTTTEQSFPSGETGTWIIELKFDAASLTDASGANVNIRVSVTAPTASNAVKIAAMRWLATTTKKAVRPGIDVGLLEAVNANSSNSQNLLISDVWDPDEVTPGIGPTTEGSSMTLRLGFADPGALDTGSGRQMIAIQFEPTGAGATPSFTATLYVNGVTTGINVVGTASSSVVPFFAFLTFSASDLGANPTSSIEVRLVTTVNGGRNIRFRGVQLIASAALDAYLYDSGWARCWPDPPNSTWGNIDWTTIGRIPMRSFPEVFFDNGSPKLVQSITARYTRVEFMVAPNGPWSFEEYDDGENLVQHTWMDVGRFSEGSALYGMNMPGGYELDPVDLSTSDVSAGGELWQDEEAIYRTVRIGLVQIPKDQAIADIFDLVGRRLGSTGDVLLIVFPEDEVFRKRAFTYGPLTRPAKPRHDSGTNFRYELEGRERL